MEKHQKLTCAPNNIFVSNLKPLDMHATITMTDTGQSDSFADVFVLLNKPLLFQTWMNRTSIYSFTIVRGLFCIFTCKYFFIYLN